MRARRRSGPEGKARPAFSCAATPAKVLRIGAADVEIAHRARHDPTRLVFPKLVWRQAEHSRGVVRGQLRPSAQPPQLARDHRSRIARLTCHIFPRLQSMTSIGLSA